MWPLNYDNTGVTVELGRIIDQGVNIWDFEYPSYYTGDEKKAFEQKVIDHYRFRQIGQETVGRWLHYFRTRMREIMPYYIQLYKFQENIDAIEDKLESYNLREEYTRTHSSEASSESSGTESQTGTGTENSGVERLDMKNNSQDSTRKFSNTPQGSITNLDNYLTEATQDQVEGTESVNSNETGNRTAEHNESGTHSGTSSTEGSGEESYTLTRKGNIGVQPLGSEVKDIRSSFINIDQMVIADLNCLFIQVY